MRRRGGRRGDGAQSDAPAPARSAGDLPEIAGYRDLSVIGRGATATVYRATQEEFGRTVAIKLLHVDISDRRAQRRFAREKTINGQLSSHPNVVTVFDSGFVDGRSPYLVMEYFGHGSLGNRLADRGPFTLEQALHVGIRIAGALESAHVAGVLHRDVKPQNILLSQFGEPALADFGIATVIEMEQSLTAGLTPVHAAPELLEHDEPSARSDVYALASTIYTLLAGSPPFAGPQGEGVLAQLLRITTMEMPALARADVPASLTTALRAAMEKRPEDRTGSAAEFGRVLQQVQTELGLARTSLPVELPDEPVVASLVVPSAAPPDPRTGGGDADDPTVDAASLAAERSAPRTSTPPSGSERTTTVPSPSPDARPATADQGVTPSPPVKPERSPFAPPDEIDTSPAFEPEATAIRPAVTPPPAAPIGLPPTPVEHSESPTAGSSSTSSASSRAGDPGPTAGIVGDEHTIVGRQRLPAAPEPKKRRPRVLLVAAASAVVAVGVGGLAIVLSGDDEPGVSASTAVSTAAPSTVTTAAASTEPGLTDTAPVTTAVAVDATENGAESTTSLVDPSQMVPTALRAWRSADGAWRLDWKSPEVTPPALNLYLLYPDERQVGPIPVDVASRTYEVVEIEDPAAPLCMVFTVPVLGEPDAPPVESALECINDASASVIGPSTASVPSTD